MRNKANTTQHQIVNVKNVIFDTFENVFRLSVQASIDGSKDLQHSTSEKKKFLFYRLLGI